MSVNRSVTRPVGSFDFFADDPVRGRICRVMKPIGTMPYFRAARRSLLNASGVVVLELHLVEPGERCPHVAPVVDGQTPAPLPIDVRKRRAGKLPSLPRS